MDTFYFRQINLPFIKKCEIIGGLMEFILVQRADISRGKEFDQRFLDESNSPSWLKGLKQIDQWLPEHTARLFWVCCELGFLRYQYPYPQRGQTYRPTRIGRWVARAPSWCATTYVAAAYVISVAAGPVQRFKKARNMTAFAMAFLVWWLNHGVSTFVIAAFATIAGIVGSWVASFVTSANNDDDLI
jgi:hypothetical protein